MPASGLARWLNGVQCRQSMIGTAGDNARAGKMPRAVLANVKIEPLFNEEEDGW